MGKHTYATSWDRYEINTRRSEQRNPLINERINCIQDKINADKGLLYQAFSRWEPEGNRIISNFEFAIRPTESIIAKLYVMFYCTHPDKSIEDEGECLYCRKCGAVDYGHGWDAFDLYQSALTIVEKANEFHAPIIANSIVATAQGHERGQKWAG